MICLWSEHSLLYLAFSFISLSQTIAWIRIPSAIGIGIDVLKIQCIHVNVLLPSVDTDCYCCNCRVFLFLALAPCPGLIARVHSLPLSRFRILEGQGSPDASPCVSAVVSIAQVVLSLAPCIRNALGMNVMTGKREWLVPSLAWVDMSSVLGRVGSIFPIPL
jgi:hypothetical protein